MQMYEGLPIITNKMPEDERRGIPHHLLGVVGLQEPTCRVDKFVSEALRTVRILISIELETKSDLSSDR
jgi:tRNA dimethylallyltransferase